MAYYAPVVDDQFLFNGILAIIEIYPGHIEKITNWCDVGTGQ